MEHEIRLEGTSYCAYKYGGIKIRLGRKLELKVDMSNYLLHDKLRLHGQMKMRKIVFYLCLKLFEDF